MPYLTNRYWCIVNTVDKAIIDFNHVIENEDTLRYSIDGTKFIVKYNGSQPACLSGYTEYSHQEILTVLAGPEWTYDEDMINNNTVDTTIDTTVDTTVAP